MNERIELPVTVALLSDSILGSGYSVPGGEDIAVCQDENGYPYLKGATFKGLLRESAENLAMWGEAKKEDIDLIFGEADWLGEAAERRLQLTQFCLTEYPEDPESCFHLRGFTSLENGIAKERSLRTAVCICNGLTFQGSLQLSQADLPLIRRALSGIKWLGTLRSRGFGRVKCEAGKFREVKPQDSLMEASCIYYWIHTDDPVVMTDYCRSSGNSMETLHYISGAAIRGVVVQNLVKNAPEWFESHKSVLLSDSVRFLDAVPNPNLGKGAPEWSESQKSVLLSDIDRFPKCCTQTTKMPAIPSILGFYEDKMECGLETVVRDGTFTPGKKRAGLGDFCVLNNDTIHFWKAHTGGVLRIQRNIEKQQDSLPFQTRYLSRGQVLEGYICLDDPTLKTTDLRCVPNNILGWRRSARRFR